MGNSNSTEVPQHRLRKLYKKYESYLLPLERSSGFGSLGDPPYSEADVLAPPMVLLLGQYSTGKTTFIKALLGREYPGADINAAAATDKFFAIHRGNQDDEIPGTALVNNVLLPFHSLKIAFGDNFLQKFRGATMGPGPGSGEDDVLKDIILIDTPGTLDGSGDRTYEYPEVMGWFARRAALILIFFDVNKTGVSTEMMQVLNTIQGNEEKIKIVFNKADTVSDIDLTGSLAGLKFHLAKSMPTPEVPKIFVTSLETLEDKYKTSNQEYIEWFTKDKSQLLDEIKRVRNQESVFARKINLLDKRSRMVRNHAYVMMELREEQKKCLSCCRRTLRAQDRERLIAAIPELYIRVQRQQNRAPGEFLSMESLQRKLRNYNLDNLPRLSRDKVEKAYSKMEATLTKLSSSQSQAQFS